MIVMHARQRIDGTEPVREQRDRGFAGGHLYGGRWVFGAFVYTARPHMLEFAD